MWGTWGFCFGFGFWFGGLFLGLFCLVFVVVCFLKSPQSEYFPFWITGEVTQLMTSDAKAKERCQSR